MTEIDVPGLLEHFSDFPDPREARGVRHKLVDIVCISILAVICGADDFTEIHEYAVAKREWLRSFLELPHDIPSHDTFQRVFAALNPGAWQARFLNWTQNLVLPELPEGEDEILAIDGKTARRSHTNRLGALHTVSVWSSQYEMVLAQEGVDEKTNEITVIPELLEVVTPAGAVVTTDALGCQKHIAWTIREHHAHYLLALKDNHPKLFADTKWLFAHANDIGWEKLEHSYAKTVDQGHGRLETRECWVLSNLEVIEEREMWRDLSCVVRVRGSRWTAGKEQIAERFFITSLPCDAIRALNAARKHWGIENGLHWVLDIAFGEDRSRARTNNAQANLVAVRHLAVSLLKRDKTIKAGVAAKRKRAGWDPDYLLKLLQS